jgi:hypothetical protein
MKISHAAAFAALLLCHVASQAAAHAHVHGVAKLDVAVEASRISIQLDSPLDNLIGFERAPRTSAESALADAAVSKLRATASMFRIDPAAQCRPASFELSSSALKLGTPNPEEEKEGHADIDGSFEFACVDAGKAKYIDVGLFEFARLQGLEVQVATPHGQFKRDLKRPATRISLGK